MKRTRFDEDPRFVQTNREALLSLGLFLLCMMWWFFSGYGLSDVSTRVFGFPLWLFMSCIVGYLMFNACIVWVVGRFFKEMPLDPYLDPKPRKQGQEKP